RHLEGAGGGPALLPLLVQLLRAIFGHWSAGSAMRWLLSVTRTRRKFDYSCQYRRSPGRTASTVARPRRASTVDVGAPRSESEVSPFSTLLTARRQLASPPRS